MASASLYLRKLSGMDTAPLYPGEDKNIYICALDGRFLLEKHVEYDWHKLDLENGVVHKKALKSTKFPQMYDRGCWLKNAAIVASGSLIYIVGGCYISRGIFKYPDKCPTQYSADVFYADTRRPQDEWKVAPKMTSAKVYPSVAASMNGKVYVFNGGDCDECFDPNANEPSWEPLGKFPKPYDVFSTVVPDPSRGRLLVHMMLKGLFAYKPDDKSWECLNPGLDTWFDRIVNVDDVLYCHGDECDTIFAYDLVTNEWLTTVWSCPNDRDFCIANWSWDAFLHLGNDILCLATFTREDTLDDELMEGIMKLVKFRFCKLPNERKVSITAVSFHEFTIKDTLTVTDFLAM